MDNFPISNDDAVYSTRNIPLRLIEYVLEAKKTHLFQLYIYLKFQCSGKIKIEVEIKNKAAIDLGVTVRTIDHRLDELKRLNWIGFNPATGMTYIRGFSNVCSFYSLIPKVAYEFSISWILDIKEFCFAAFMQNLLNYRKWREHNANKCDKKGRSSFGLQQGSPLQKQLSDLYKTHKNALTMFPSPFLSKLLNLSLSTISELKNNSNTTGFLVITKNFVFLTDRSDEIEAKHHFLKAMPEIENLMYTIGNKLYLRFPDSFSTTLKRKHRRMRY